MTYKAIPMPEDYYVIVSDEEIKMGDLYYFRGFTIHKTIEKIHPRIKELIQNGEIKEYKVISQSKQVHEGVPLIELPWEDIEQIANNSGIPLRNANTTERVYYNGLLDGFIKGYSKHAEKYEFTEEDMMGFAGHMAACDHSLSFMELREEAERYIQSLKKPKSYEVELETEDAIYPFNQIDPEVKPLVKKIPLIVNGKGKIVKWKEI